MRIPVQLVAFVIALAMFVAGFLVLDTALMSMQGLDLIFHK